MAKITRFVVVVLVVAASLGACSGGDRLTVYVGRPESVAKPILHDFTKATGIKVSARYGAGADLAARMAENGGRPRADVLWADEAADLGSLDRQGLLAAIPPAAATGVDARFHAADDGWVGVSGRARVVVYDPGKVPVPELPATVFSLTESKWRGRIAIAPTSGGFQSFVAAMVSVAGEARASTWLGGIKANEPRIYPSEDVLVKAVNDGAVDLGLSDHDQVFRLRSLLGADKAVARNHVTAGADPGALVNVAAVGIVKSSKRGADAGRFVEYLLSEPAQHRLADRDFEYPVRAGVPTAADVPPLRPNQGPNVNLGDLGDIGRTRDLLRQAGLL